MIPSNWPDCEFPTIYADIPWRFLTWSEAGGGRSPEYPTMSMEELFALPVADIAARDCTLLMWVIDSMIPEALDLIRRYGFVYKTVAFTWAKLNPSGQGWHMGMGRWTRNNPEQCFLATRGRPRRLAADVRQLIVSPLREHSRKPDSIYSDIERLVDGPYCELFGRCRRPGWASCGNDLDLFPTIAG